MINSIFKRFESLLEAFPAHIPQTPPEKISDFFKHCTSGSWALLILLCGLSGLVAIIEVILFGFVGQIVDWLSVSNRATFWSDHWLELLGISSLLLVVSPIVVFAQSLILHQSLLGNLPMRMRWYFHHQLLQQSLNFYAEDFAGRISTKMMQTALALRDTLVKLSSVAIYISVYVISIAILLASTNVWLAFPIVLWVCMYIVILWFFLPRMQRISIQQANARSNMTGRVVDSYANIMTVKLFSHSSREINYAKDAMDPFLATVYRQMRLSTGMKLAVEYSVFLTVFVEVILAIFLWTHEAASLGMIAVAIMVTLRLNGLSEWIMWEANLFFENLGTVIDGSRTLAKPVSVNDGVGAKPLTLTNGLLEFNNVSFSYSDTVNIIQQLNFTIRPGEKVGIVGRSGAGKSTLVNLLLRFYDIQQGQILIDHQNIAHVQQESLRQAIGVVTQDTSLLHRTVRENILYGSPGASQAAMVAAAKQAHAYDFIQNLVDHNGNTGFDALVGERGIKLSGGQRQRIALCRVLLKNAPILVLDEATSALDSEVEQAIQDSLDALMNNKTVIAIAHRLSTIAALDRLVIIDQGQIVEQGTHADLLQQGGIYAQLWAHQSGGFI